MTNWICSRCSNDEKVERLELPDGRLRPFCKRCRPKDAKPPMPVADFAFSMAFVSAGVQAYASALEKHRAHWQRLTAAQPIKESEYTDKTNIAPPAFAVGQWVRGKDGQLMRLLTREPRYDTISGQRGWRCEAAGPADYNFTFEHLIEPATPRAGEWWVITDSDLPSSRLLMTEEMAKGDAIIGFAQRGDIVPLNFGRGEA